MFWEVEERYWPEELEFKNFVIDNAPVEDWLQPVVRRNRYFWEIALEYMPWYEAPDGHRYKVVCLGFPNGRRVIFKSRKVLVVDRNLEPAPLRVGRDAVRCMVYSTAWVQCLNRKALRMWVPGNEIVSNMFLDTLARWREALHDHPDPKKKERYRRALDRATEFFTFLKENNERANRSLENGVREVERFRQRIREQGYGAVVRHGEPEAICDVFKNFTQIRWYYTHDLQQEHRNTGHNLLAPYWDRFLRQKMKRQDYVVLKECYSTIETVVHARNWYRAARTPREGLLGNVDRLAEMEARAVALPR